MIEFATGLLFLTSGAFSMNQNALIINGVFGTSSPLVYASHATLTHINEPQTIEQYVREYFALNPIMAEVARCESRFTHHDSKGNVLRGRKVPDDVGIMQINTFYHQATADKLGIDLMSLDGNLKFAEYLFKKSGTQPWSASQACWGKSTAV